MFASMYAAYEALTPQMKSYLQGLTATHDGRLAYAQDAAVNLPITVHPLITKHPETGRKVIYFTGAVVTKNVPPRVIVVGNPARVLRDVPEDELL